EGGIIWHTQGSGKSLVMVWLAKWVLENNPHARVLILTDRIELDKQIKRVFEDTGEEIYRTKSGKDLMKHLNQVNPRLLCTLMHKFGARVDSDAFIEELEKTPAQVQGELFVFVDECHRTQSSKLHKAMKAVLQTAVFIGFTGTPLLKKDKKTSMEVFGKYIHTYKMNEAVEDEVILDLMYEARDIDQRLSSPEKVDAWFEAKTKGLNDFQKFALKKKWGTMQKVLGVRQRFEKIVSDIVLDFSTRPRLSSDFGNAILIANSIHEASRYFDMFQSTPLKGKCALITSYNPIPQDIATEDTGASTETEKEFVYKTYKALLGKQTTEKYEDKAKEKFIKEPASMKLLIVVDKLLTGFDAPPCSYLYIDKKMQDHGLFQAICRVNRLDSEDKQFGYIVDYKDLFCKVENAVSVYTSELDYDRFDKKDVDVLLPDRLSKARERLDNALEALALLCENVESPKDSLAFIRYFCGNPEKEADLKNSEAKRVALYKGVVSLIRAYSNIATELGEAGYTPQEMQEIQAKVDFYGKLREEIRRASGEVLDLKTYESDMRHLMDTYIQAEDSKRIDPFQDQSLLEILLKHGIEKTIDALPERIRKSEDASSETIANNVRVKIIKEHLTDPAYFAEMSRLLEEIIKERKAKAISYQEYLAKIAELTKKVYNIQRSDLPITIRTNAQRALYNNLGKDESLAISVDEAVHSSKMADWRGNIARENPIKYEIYRILKDKDEVERISSWAIFP
ncbi:MAG: HsdR family type I site-specific deoxyribonuclease, partial [Candidatus Brocadiae bacterium]|nr:HsdR family type I site-specific deoxyribonuclease [Candidatus Brocadiia bacterium]